VKSTQVYFVQKMLNAILSRWPNWKQHLQTSDQPYSKTFCIMVPAQNSDVTRGLSVVTDGRMIVVGFDVDHDHLIRRKKEGLPQFRQRVISRISDVLEDRICAVSWLDNGKWGTSCGFRSRSEVRENVVRTGFACRVRSWSGKLDQDFIEK
jgi:hypothetical protein